MRCQLSGIFLFLLFLAVPAGSAAGGSGRGGAGKGVGDIQPFGEAQIQQAIDDCETDYLKVDLPDLFDSAFNIGKVGHMDVAEKCFQRYAGREPANSKAWALIAELMARRGDAAGAIAAARASARIDGETPQAAEGYFLLANSMMSQNKYGLARQHYYRAIRLDPEHVNSMVNLGVVLGSNNDYAEAIPIYRRALEVEPTIMAARHNLGSALHTLKLFKESLAVLEPLMRDEPKCFECLLTLGHCLSDVKQLERAKGVYKSALDIRPSDPDALLNYYYSKQMVIDWEEREPLFRRLESITETQLAQRYLTTVGPYYSLLSPFDQEQMLGIAESHASRAHQRVEWMLPGLPPTFGLELEPPLHRMRVGYVMADFRHHVTAHLLQTVFERHDVDRFEVFCYALNPDDRSAFRRKIMESVEEDHFREVDGNTDLEVSIAINNDLVDILIDTDYYKSRLSILATRPAAVQVNFLAHPGTSGAAYVDHIVADPIVAPPDHGLFFSESILYMSHHYQVNDHVSSYPYDQGKTRDEIRRSEGLPQSAFVYCNFNGLYKVEPEQFEVWVRILKRAPGSVLWLVNENDESNANLLRQAESRGLDPARIVLAERADFAQHITRVRAADVFLDSFTYNAHTTAVDSLWGGLPVVTLPGWNMNMRLASGALSSFGPASETCVRTVGEYEEVAVAMASHVSRKRIQKRLHEHWGTSQGQEGGRSGLEKRPLFDTKSWVQDLEGGLAMMADLSANGIGRGETEAQFWAGGGAGGQGRRHHLVRAHRSEWGPQSRLF